MKYVFLTLTVLGIVVAALALREHYREYGDSPCSINERWDCGVVNHSPYAMVGGALGATNIGMVDRVLNAIPVAVAGILGYFVMAVVSWFRSYRVLLALVLISLGFSLHLAGIEKNILGVWCIYCVISLGIICVMTLLSLGTVIVQLIRRPSPA